MEPKFVQIGATTLNLSQVAGVEELVDGGLRIHTTAGWHPEFHGDEANAMRAFFAPKQEANNGQAASGV